MLTLFKGAKAAKAEIKADPQGWAKTVRDEISTELHRNSVPLEALLSRLKVSDRTLTGYRQLALEIVSTYQVSAYRRGLDRPRYGKKPTCIDEPPFTRVEALILIAIMVLFKEIHYMDGVKQKIQDSNFCMMFDYANIF